MKLYDCTASCLVDDILLHYVVIAKNEKRRMDAGLLSLQL